MHKIMCVSINLITTFAFFPGNGKTTEKRCNMILSRSTSILSSLVFSLAILVGPFSVHGCLFSRNGSAVACAETCCAMKTCCAKPAGYPVPSAQALATSQAGPELSLSSQSAVKIIARDFQSQSQLPECTTKVPCNSRLARALLCTFLI